MIATGQATTTGFDVLSAGPTSNYGVVLVSLCNVSASLQICQVYVIPNGSAVANAYKIVSNYSLIAGDSLFLSVEKILLGPLDRITVVSTDNSAVNVHVSYTSL